MNCPDCGHELAIGDWPFRCWGVGDHDVRFQHSTAGIHESEKCHVLHNPRTGEIRVPGRADRPIHPKYAAAGFEKVEMHPRDVERRTGRVSEVLNYDKNSARADRDVGST